jgi:hypothetical protein
MKRLFFIIFLSTSFPQTSTPLRRLLHTGFSLDLIASLILSPAFRNGTQGAGTCDSRAWPRLIFR